MPRLYSAAEGPPIVMLMLYMPPVFIPVSAMDAESSAELAVKVICEGKKAAVAVAPPAMTALIEITTVSLGAPSKLSCNALACACFIGALFVDDAAITVLQQWVWKAKELLNTAGS